MMWHWNSMWAPAPGDPPAVDDPVLWRSPWSAEQSIALQARTWDTLVSTSRSWWSFWLAAWPVPTWPQVGQVAPIETEAAHTPLPPPRKKPSVPRTSAPSARKQSSRNGARDGLKTHGR